MKAKDLFLQYFKEDLAGHGFRRKGKFFFRMNGEILQGIGVDAVPFRYYVRYSQFPFWCYRLLYKDLPLSKGYWLNDGDYPAMSFFSNAKPEKNIPEMEFNHKAYQTEIFPLLDATVDEKTYIEAKSKRRFEVDRWFMIPPHAILYACYLDGSWEYAQNWIARKRDECQSRAPLYAQKEWETHLYFLKNPPEGYVPTECTYEELLEEKMNFFDRTLKSHFGLLLEKMEQNDLNWIKDIHDSESEYMRELLKTELKIIV
jgi:hypothetical protein